MSRGVCAQRGDDRIQIRLAGAAAHRRDRARRRHPRPRRRLQNARGVDAAGVVRVEVNRDADLLAQRLHQFVRGVRLAEAGHVLDGQEMRAHALPVPSPS